MPANTSFRSYWVYILASRRNGTLYVGVTNSIRRRMWQHKNQLVEGFTKKHGVDLLVHLEEFRNIDRAISREKQIKGWLRKRKLGLTEAVNPEWNDLSAGWHDTRWILRSAQNDTLRMRFDRLPDICAWNFRDALRHTNPH